MVVVVYCAAVQRDDLCVAVVGLLYDSLSSWHGGTKPY